MLTALDVANFFVYLMGDEEDNDLSNLKLNKLVYYAHGHTLKNTGKPLFSESIKAWTHGPVVPSVYYAFKDNKNKPVTDFAGEFNLEKYEEKDIELMIDVARELGKYSASALRNMTHQEGTPWTQCYKEQGRDGVISDEAIKEFFCANETLQEFTPSLDGWEEIGYRDSNDCLVLSKEHAED